MYTFICFICIEVFLCALAFVFYWIAKACCNYINTHNISTKPTPLTKEQIHNIAHARNSKEAKRLLNQYRGRWF